MRLSEGLGEEEQLYKSLYARCPEVWEEPVEDWAGLVRRCHKAGINDIPNEAPSMMGSVLTEDDFSQRISRRLSALITSGIVRRFFISWSSSRLFMCGAEA